MTITWLQAQPALHVTAKHAEGVVWDPAGQRLLFVDIASSRVFEHDPTISTTVIHQLDRHVSDVHHTVGGGLLVAVREGVALLSDRHLRVLVAPLADLPDMRMNDGNVDPCGRLFVGSMAYDSSPRAGALYRLSSGGHLTTMLSGVTISNGIDWSPDGAAMFYIDSPTRRVDVFDYNLESGALYDRRVFASIENSAGLPDGLTVDAQGGVWVALFGGGQVRRYTSEGRLDCVVEVPNAELVTSCCFAGSGLDQLYITTSTENLTPEQLERQLGAGRLYRVIPGHYGKPATPFRLTQEALTS